MLLDQSFNLRTKSSKTDHYSLRCIIFPFSSPFPFIYLFLSPNPNPNSNPYPNHDPILFLASHRPTRALPAPSSLSFAYNPPKLSEPNHLAPTASLYHSTPLSPNPLFLSLLTFLLPNLSSQPKFMTLSPKNGKRIFFTV